MSKGARVRHTRAEDLASEDLDTIIAVDPKKDFMNLKTFADRAKSAPAKPFTPAERECDS